MAIQIKLKNSVVQDSTPSTSDLPVVGELALNANINSIGGFMRASDNTIVKIFGPGSLSTPTATTTVSGISELATNSETTTGTATNRVVTPAGLNAVTTAERTTSNTNYVAKAGSTLTGVLTMPNGSNSAPAINFGDSDSGIFGGTNTVSLAAGGTTRLTADTGVSVVGTLAVTGAITSTDDLTIPDKIIHSGDTNTAIRFPAADTVSVETGGSEKLRVDSSGRLLLGTSSSRAIAGTSNRVFQIEGASGTELSGISITRNSANTGGSFLSFGKSRASSVGGNTVVQSGDVLGVIQFAGADGTDIQTKGAEIKGEVDGTPGSNDMPGRLVFSTTADGASSPTTRLTIDSAGTSTFTGNITTTGNITGSDITANGGDLTISGSTAVLHLTDTNNDDDFSVMNENGTFIIRDATDSANRLTVNSSGTVDVIGNLDVGAGLDVTGAITGTGDVTITKASPVLRLADTTDPQGSDGSIGKIEFFGNDGSSGGANVRSFIQTISTNSTGNAHALVIGLGESNNAPTEKVRILGDGKVGIGTSPSTLLHIRDTAISGYASQSSTLLVLEDSGDTSLEIASGNNNTSSVFFGDTGASNKGRVSYHNGTGGDAMAFHANDSERMRIDSSGRLLLGTTTEGNSSADDLTIATSGSTGITIRSGTSNAGNIYFSDGTSGTAEYAGYISYSHSTNKLSFGTNDGSERLSIDSSGRLLIGTTTEGTTDSDDLTIATSGNTGMTIRSGTTSNGAIHFSDATSGAGEYAGYIDYDHNVDKFDMGNNSGRFLSSDSNRVVSIGNASFGGSSGVIGYGSLGGVRKDSILALNASATVAGRGAGVSVGGTASALGSFYCSKSGNADSDGGSVYLESVGALYFRTGGTNDRANIDSNGNFLIGTSSVIASGTERPFQIQNTGGPKIALGRNDTSISAGNTMGGLEFYGNDSDGTFVNCASIIVNADDTHSTNSKATRMQFFTTANNSASATERLRITNAGQILLGGATASHGSSNADDLQIGANNQSNQTGITLGSASGSSVRFADAGDDTAGAILYAHGDDTMRFTAASSERVRIDSDGIKFSGDSSANSGLNDYEQGTWTATAEFSTGGFKSCANNVCRYVKIGNLVHVSGRFSLNNHTGATSGELRIEGLPFSKGNPSGDGNSDGICIYLEGAKTTVSTGISGLVLDSTTQFLVRQSGTTASGNDMTGKTDTGTTLLIGGTYSTFG